jgi:ferredoxin-type protein NapG
MSNARKRQLNRRQLLTSAGVGAGVVGFSLVGYVPLQLRAEARLRPPGALDERDFLSACIKCGQCVQVCPVEALVVADLVDGFGVGAPYIEARDQACDFSCDVGQCILACPTGALTYHRPVGMLGGRGRRLPEKPVLLAKAETPDPTLNLEVRMGRAQLTRPDACLSVRGEGVSGSARGDRFRGKKRWTEVDRWAPQPVRDYEYDLERCDLCVRECPIEGAIAIEDRDGVPTPIVKDACVGCGVCEMMCPAEPTAIEVHACEGHGRNEDHA